MVLAPEPVEEMDIVGPLAVFGHANRLLARETVPYEIQLVGTSHRSFVRGDCGLSLITTSHYKGVRGQVDTFLIAGGNGAIETRDKALVDWIVKMSQKTRRIGSICTGAFLLAEAGLLDGRRATTHWLESKHLAARFPKVTVDSDSIWIRDGNVYTSAGITAGMDLALALLEEDYGAKTAVAVAMRLVMFARRAGGQAQFSVLLAADAAETSAFRELQTWLPQNLKSDLSVRRLAKLTAMSPRSFARAFVRDFGITPARYTQKVRVEAGRRVLETTDKSLEAVASCCGFGNLQSMRRAFLRVLGVGPKEYKLRFSAPRQRTYPA